VVNALLPKRNQKDITSLIEEFQYPRLGPGMMWERCADLVERQGGRSCWRPRSRAVHREPAAAPSASPRRHGGYGRARAPRVPRTDVGTTRRHACDQLVSPCR
jgi:UDP-galactopyranose mutase